MFSFVISKPCWCLLCRNLFRILVAYFPKLHQTNMKSKRKFPNFHLSSACKTASYKTTRTLACNVHWRAEIFMQLTWYSHAFKIVRCCASNVQTTGEKHVSNFIWNLLFEEIKLCRMMISFLLSHLASTCCYYLCSLETGYEMSTYYHLKQSWSARAAGSFATG